MSMKHSLESIEPSRTTGLITEPTDPTELNIGLGGTPDYVEWPTLALDRI